MRNLHRVRGPADEHLQLRGGERFWKVVPRPSAQGFEAARDTRIAGHDDDQRVLVGGERGAEDVHSRDRRHVQVEEDHIETLSTENVQRFVAPSRYGDGIAVQPEYTAASVS